MLQWFHSCHHLIVPRITHNYSWQCQRHSAMLTKDATFLPVWSGKLKMLQSCLEIHREEQRAKKSAVRVSALVSLHKTLRLRWKVPFTAFAVSTYSTVAYPVHTGLRLPCPDYASFKTFQLTWNNNSVENKADLLEQLLTSANMKDNHVTRNGKEKRWSWQPLELLVPLSNKAPFIINWKQNKWWILQPQMLIKSLTKCHRFLTF